MLKVRIWAHRDGDGITIVRVPWYYEMLYWVLERASCPEHLPLRLIAQSSERIFNWLWDLNTKWQLWHFDLAKELYTVKIPSYCEASVAIYGDKDDVCWRDDCPTHGKQNKEN